MGTILKYGRRATHKVRFGNVTIGGNNPIAIQSMTNTPTANVEATVAQTMRIAKAGAQVVRLTAQGGKEGEALAPIMSRLREEGCGAAIVADIHFTPDIAMVAAEAVDKVRIGVTVGGAAGIALVFWTGWRNHKKRAAERAAAAAGAAAGDGDKA